jgi:hypothetical protein
MNSSAASKCTIRSLKQKNFSLLSFDSVRILKHEQTNLCAENQTCVFERCKADRGAKAKNPTIRKIKMNTQTQWSVSNVENAKYLGTLEINDEAFEVLATDTKLVFGSACNAGFLESGYILRESFESLDETLQELHSDIETYYRDGASYVSRIVCNERM